LAQDVIGGDARIVETQLMHKGLSARQECRRKKALREILGIPRRGCGCHGCRALLFARTISAPSHVARVREVRYEQVTLLKVIAASEFLPHEARQLLRELYEADRIPLYVGLEGSAKRTLVRELAMATLWRRDELAQAALDV